MIFLHQVLGKGLGALDLRRRLGGAEGRDPRLRQSVHHAQHQRIVRGHHRIVHPMLLAKLHRAGHVRGRHRHADCVLCHAPVSRQGIDLRNGAVFSQFFDHGVLSAAASDHRDFHFPSPLCKRLRFNGGTGAFR